MEARDLMIDDWVKQRYSYFVFKVSAIRNRCVEGREDDGEFYEDNIEPIPVTPEILEANGFVNRADAGYQRREDELANRHLTYYDNSGMFGVGLPFVGRSLDLIHRIKYVHELQHALRLCGLKELADNFKL